MAISASRVTRFGIGGGIWSPAGDFSTKQAGFAAPGGPVNAAEYFPTGQADVVITLYDPESPIDTTVTLTSNACVEFGTSGLYFWDATKIASTPVPYKEYGYIMTDGSTSQGGILEYDDFLIQYIIHEEYGI